MYRELPPKVGLAPRVELEPPEPPLAASARLEHDLHAAYIDQRVPKQSVMLVRTTADVSVWWERLLSAPLRARAGARPSRWRRPPAHQRRLVAAPALDRYMFSSAFSLFGRRSPPRR